MLSRGDRQAIRHVGLGVANYQRAEQVHVRLLQLLQRRQRLLLPLPADVPHDARRGPCI